MINYTTTQGVNRTSTISPDFFLNLQKYFNISRRTLIIIGVVAIVVIIIILWIIIYFIRKCLNKDKDRKKKRNEGNADDIFGNDAEKYESKYGYIDLSVTYDRKKKKLVIRDIQANNLVSPSTEPPDCFAKVFLKNQKGKKYNLKKTKIKVDNYTPFFEETFNFYLDDIKNQTIYFQIIDDNPNGNDILLGEGKLEMQKLQTDSYIGLICQTYVILEKPMEKEGCGDICIILSSRLNKQRIAILEAKDLVYKFAKKNSIGVFKYPSVFAEVAVFINKSRKHHFNTKTLHNTENPYFMETFEFTIKSKDLIKTCIKVQINEFTSLKVSKKVGRVYLGNPEYNSKIKAIGKFHWDSACDDQYSPKAMWHSLVR